MIHHLLKRQPIQLNGVRLERFSSFCQHVFSFTEEIVKIAGGKRCCRAKSGSETLRRTSGHIGINTSISTTLEKAVAEHVYQHRNEGIPSPEIAHVYMFATARGCKKEQCGIEL